MPAHTTTRNLAGNARIPLDAQRGDLEEITAIFREMDASFDNWFHHAMRRLAECNGKRREAIKALDALQTTEEALAKPVTRSLAEVAA